MHAVRPTGMYLLIFHLSGTCFGDRGHAGGLAELTLVFSQVLMAVGRVPPVLTLHVAASVNIGDREAKHWVWVVHA